MSSKDLKAITLRSIWLELIQSLAILDIPVQLVIKLRWVFERRSKKGVGFEYDPETNSLDAVSSNEEL